MVLWLALWACAEAKPSPSDAASGGDAAAGDVGGGP
jgi:hypothetical protein